MKAVVRNQTMRYWLYNDYHVQLVIWSDHIDVTIDSFGVCPYTLRPRNQNDKYKSCVHFVLETQKRGYYTYLDTIPLLDAEKAIIDGIMRHQA